MPRVGVGGSLVGDADELFDAVLEDRLDQSLTRRETAVQRPDADAGPLRRHLPARR